MRGTNWLLLIILSTLTDGCLIGDAAIKIKGRFVDQDKAPYQDCVLTVMYQDKVAKASKVSGEFQETIVFSPTSRDPLILSGYCTGARGSYTRMIEEIPKSFTEHVDLGDMELQRQ